MKKYLHPLFIVFTLFGLISCSDAPETNKTIKTDTETITKISDFVWELSTEMDAIKDQMEVLQLRMLSVRKMLQIMEDPKNGTAQDHATRRGWDCFKENNND